VALFNGLFAYLAASKACDAAYIADHTSGFEQALATAGATSLEEIADITGLSRAEIAAFYRSVASTERTVTVYSQGVNQSSAGTDKVNAIINCHLATGRIGKPGSGPFSITGQPNAMGGRETGGLATMLAAHMDLDNAEHRARVQSFWGSPHIADKPGLKAVDLFEAVHSGQIKAVWVMATNPVDSLPNADRVRDALGACPFVAVSDVTRDTDTTAVADVLLPAAAWGEKDGTVTNSERRISRQKRFLPLPGDVQPDWWHIAEVATRLGFGAAFDYSGPDEIYREYAALTALENNGTRDLDLSGHTDLSRAAYDALTPSQWPLRERDAAADNDTGDHAQKRFFADGGFFTADGLGRFVPTAYRAPASAASPERPFVLNTGRVRDQWHTMTRTAKTPRLTAHISEPFVELHPADAKQLGMNAADLVQVESAHGQLIARAVPTTRIARGSVFVPMHWTARSVGHARSRPGQDRQRSCRA
ncbi:MAG: molybdopterin-dependent oxidoreductase, partial [Pseudomonadota bacterium]